MSDMRRMMMMFTRPVESSGDIIPVPTISPSAGAILPTQTISISISGMATSAEYSFDNQTWLTYSSPFTLPSATTVYARATDGSGNYSEVVSNAYTILPYDAQVEWLGSDSTAYIDTGVNGNNYYLRFTGHFIYTTHVNYGAIYGNYVSDNHNGTRLILNNASNKAVSCLNTKCTTNGNTIVTLTINVKHSFLVNYNEVTIDSTTTTVSNKGSGTTNNGNVCIFNRSLTNTVNRNIGLKIYDFQIYDNGVLIRDYIPVRVGTVGYMYDTVSGELFGNSGSGSFTYGNDIIT